MIKVAVPLLHVSSAEAAGEFYCGKLGFRLEFAHRGDEKKLETPEYRQKIADSLYKGISKYVSGLSGVKVASKFDKDAGK